MEASIAVPHGSRFELKHVVSTTLSCHVVEQNKFTEAVCEEQMEWTAYGEQGPGCAVGPSVSSMDDNETPMEID